MPDKVIFGAGRTAFVEFLKAHLRLRRRYWRFTETARFFSTVRRRWLNKFHIRCTFAEPEPYRVKCHYN